MSSRLGIIQRLNEIAGKDYVLTSDEDLLVYAFDASAPAMDIKPLAIIFPENPAEISEILVFANERNIPIIPRGSGTGLAGATKPTPESIILITNRLNRILSVDTANLTALVEPGVRTIELAEAAESFGLFYPPDPGSMSISTLGGNVALNSGGLRGLKYGVTQDYVLGLEVVLSNGDILHTGSQCKKDVAGYNLTSLFIGSEGTLGVITKILVRLIPLPEKQKTVLTFFAAIDQAAQVVADIISSRIIPVTLEILDNICIRCVDDYAGLGLPRDAGAMLLIEVDGPEQLINQEIVKINAICNQNGAKSVQIAQNEAQANQLKTARRFTLAALARRSPTMILEDVTVPRDKIPKMVGRIRDIADQYQVEIAIFGHAGDGNLHPTGMTDSRNHEELERVERAFDEIFTAALDLGGTITGEHGVGIKKRHILPKKAGAIGMKTMEAIKLALDPNNILNPGKIFSL